MKVLPKGKYEYDTYSLTELVTEIDEFGNDYKVEAVKTGVIEAAQDELELVGKTKKFENGQMVEMSEEELRERVLHYSSVQAVQKNCNSPNQDYGYESCNKTCAAEARDVTQANMCDYGQCEYDEFSESIKQNETCQSLEVQKGCQPVQIQLDRLIGEFEYIVQLVREYGEGAFCDGEFEQLQKSQQEVLRQIRILRQQTEGN